MLSEWSINKTMYWCINDKFDAIAVGISIIIILDFCQILSKIGTISLENLNNDALFLAEKFV